MKICENAICRFGGSAGEEMRALLVKQQYPKGTVFLRQDSLGPTVLVSKEDEQNHILNRFPKFTKPLFEVPKEQNSSNNKMLKKEISHIN